MTIPHLNQIGITTDHRAVIGGLFEMRDTHGLPLEVLLKWCQDQNSVPDWLELWGKAGAAGYNMAAFRTRISEACGDVYGPEVRAHIMKRLDNATM